jgi:hypothetical protein
MKKIRIISFLLLISLFNIHAQKKNFSFDLGSSVGYITSGHVPFWFRSNQFGSIPLDNASLSLIGAVRKDYDPVRTRVLDWGASVEGRVNIGHKSNFTLIEGYGKIRISVFEIRAGRSKEIMGLCDTSLTSGAWAVSGNALGIPKVQICIPEFYSLPIFGKLFAFKGNYAHGWIGETSFKNLNGNILQTETWVHQKSLYGRFGKSGWKWKLYGGFNHQVLWGNEKDSYGDSYTLSPVKAYLYVITGKALEHARIGDQLGSLDLGFEYEFKNIRLLAYRQNLYDAGALYYLANIRDGLNGLSLVNKRYTLKGFQWRKILVEVLYTKSQGGELWAAPRSSGAENYYNHSLYIQGWSYKGIGIGNPFICSRAYAWKTLPSDPADYFINNRVVAFHFGFKGSIQEWDFILKTSYSLNCGTYRTSEVGFTWPGGVRTPPMYGIFSETKQFSAYLEANKELENGLNIGFTGAFDVGGLYYDSFGILVKVAKSF